MQEKASQLTEEDRAVQQLQQQITAAAMQLETLQTSAAKQHQVRRESWIDGALGVGDLTGRAAGTRVAADQKGGAEVAAAGAAATAGEANRGTGEAEGGNQQEEAGDREVRDVLRRR